MSAVYVQSVKPIWERTKESDEHMGWVFPDTETEQQGAEPDPFNGVKSIRALYELASENYSGKYTVPVCIPLFSLYIYERRLIFLAFRVG